MRSGLDNPQFDLDELLLLAEAPQVGGLVGMPLNGGRVPLNGRRLGLHHK